MTSDRLARLRAWSDTQAYVYGDGVKRLLDEREALEKALSGFVEWFMRHVSADFNTGDPPRRIEELATAHRVLDQVSKP